VGNLFAIFHRFSHVFVFILLQFICFKLLYKSSPKHGKSIARSADEITGKVLTQKKSVTDYFYLKAINDQLLKENAGLRQKLLQEETGNPLKDSVGNITFQKDSVQKNFRYHYFPARVLDHSFDEPNNYMTLSLGKYAGVKKGMAVMSANGIAGVIVDVSPHFSVAKSIISEKFNVSGQLSDGLRGYINWPSIDSRFVQLNDISVSAKVKRGDTVFTSTSSMFPAKIMIGTIAAFKPSVDANNYTVLLSTNFKKLEYVYIIEDITAEEMNTLKDSVKASEKPANPKLR
jgi:rod shape-determining protein MreC